MSFSCPNFDYETEFCKNLKVSCVPGRSGCVLDGMVTLAGDIKDQINNTENLNQTKRAKHRINPGDKHSP